MKSKKRTIGILIVVIIVLLGFAGSLLIYKNNLSSENKNNNSNDNITQPLSSVSPQRYLEGFYNKPITDEKIALDSIEENRVHLGYDDKNLSFEFMRKDEYMGVSYRFKLLYKGVPLNSKEVRVLVDENGTARKLLSREISIKQLNTINTTPKITEDEAINIAKETLGDNFSEYNISANLKKIRIRPELVIYDTYDQYALSYYINSGSYICVINAENGEIITSKSILLSNIAEFEGQNGDKHTIYYDDYKDENNDIKNALWDKNNNIYIFDNVFNPNIEDIMTMDNIKSGKNKTAVDAMANTYRAVEYFKINHNMTFDATLSIVNYLNFDLMYNSGGTSYINDNGSVAKICFGTSFGTKQDSAYLDIVAHEYAHAVTGLRAFGSDGYSTDSKHFERDALREAYSDIFGQLIEQEYTGTTDWSQNLNILGKRDLKQPKISNYSELGKNAHDNSTIISHTAYLMSKDNDNSEWDSKYLLEYEQLGKLWFGSLDYLDTESNFVDCRWAIEESARDLIEKGVLLENNLKIIEQAFNEVEVSSNPTRRGMTDSMKIIKDKNTIVVPIEDETQSTEFVEITEVPTEPSNWQQLYADELKRYMASDKYNNESMFDLYDIDNDGIPELFISEDGMFTSYCTVYTIYNGRIIKSSNNSNCIYSGGIDNLQLQVSQSTKTFRSGGIGIISYQKLENGQFISIFEGNEHQNVYTINGEMVTAEKYREEESKYKYSADDYINVGRKYKLDEITINSILLNFEIISPNDFNIKDYEGTYYPINSNYYISLNISNITENSADIYVEFTNDSGTRVSQNSYIGNIDSNIFTFETDDGFGKNSFTLEFQDDKIILTGKCVDCYSQLWGIPEMNQIEMKSS